MVAEYGVSLRQIFLRTIMHNNERITWTKEWLSKTLGIVVGAVFLFSGISKMLNVTEFAFLIQSYGLWWAANFAPLIVIIEIATGILLVLGIQPRKISLFAILMLVGFTIIYGYGHFTHGVENCGCFGAAGDKTPFWLVLLRNVFLILFMVVVFKQTNIDPVLIKWKPTVVIFIIVVSSFVSGMTFYPLPMSSSVNESHSKNNIIGKVVSEVSEPLSKLLTADSSYFVFMFSYNCPYCWNSIENLKQYTNLPKIDKIIAITTTDTANSALFKEQFKPQFPIYALSSGDTETLVKGHPTSLFIENGYIRQVFEGELPCSHFMKQMIEKEETIDTNP